MITFIKSDKYISFLNFLIVLIFLLFNVSYYWFLLLELSIIMIFLVFMLFRFHIRSKVRFKELETINKLRKMNFKYEDYQDLYEDYMDFELEIKGYKKLLETISINFLRMDNKLDIIDYSVVDQGLELLEKNIKDNKNRKKDYEHIKDSIDIIKKYYDKEGIRKDKTKNHKTMLIICGILGLISLLLLLIYFVFNKIEIYSIVSTIYIIILVVVNIIYSHINR